MCMKRSESMKNRLNIHSGLPLSGLSLKNKSSGFDSNNVKVSVAAVIKKKVDIYSPNLEWKK